MHSARSAHFLGKLLYFRERRLFYGEYRETRTLHLPGGDTRTLILCKKISQTPTAYPRNGGKIAKSPLK